MKRFLFALLLTLGLATANATPMSQVNREVQYWLYNYGSTGAADWWLLSNYGITLQDFYYFYDYLQYDGAVEMLWAY